MNFLKTLPVLLALTAPVSAHALDFKAIERCDANQECLKLTEVLYYEARGESKEGIIAVGQVVVNRSIRSSSAIVDVVEKKSFVKDRLVCQFSYICDIFYKKLPEKVEDSYLDKYKVIAQGIIDNKFPDYAQGADHFFKDSITFPVWSKGMAQVASIGNHVFFDSTKEPSYM